MGNPVTRASLRGKSFEPMGVPTGQFTYFERHLEPMGVPMRRVYRFEGHWKPKGLPAGEFTDPWEVGTGPCTTRVGI